MDELVLKYRHDHAAAWQLLRLAEDVVIALLRTKMNTVGPPPNISPFLLKNHYGILNQAKNPVLHTQNKFTYQGRDFLVVPPQIFLTGFMPYGQHQFSLLREVPDFH